MKKTIIIFIILIILSFLAAGMAADYSTTPTSPVWHTYDSSLRWFYQQLNMKEKKAFSSRYDAYAFEIWICGTSPNLVCLPMNRSGLNLHLLMIVRS